MSQLNIFRARTFGVFKVCSRTFAAGGSAGDGSDGDETKGKAPKSPSQDELMDKINQLLKGMSTVNTAAQKLASERPEVQEVGSHRAKPPKKSNENKSPLDKLKVAAAAAAKSVGGDAESIEREILAKALGEEPVPDPTDLDWSKLISGMAVDNTQSVDDPSRPKTRSQQVRGAFARIDREFPDFKESNMRPRSMGDSKSKVQQVDLFGGKPLGIFKKQPPNYGTEMKVWQDLEQFNLRLAVTHPPRNYFEKMIQWTKQGKIWKFPIDNEQGLEEEQSVGFEEHIFLEKHLQGWCPDKGPIRHFMELVCVGLSKNPYYKVQDKINHIMWFKEYFESKKKLLEEVGAYETDSAPKLSA